MYSCFKHKSLLLLKYKKYSSIYFSKSFLDRDLLFIYSHKHSEYRADL